MPRHMKRQTVISPKLVLYLAMRVNQKMPPCEVVRDRVSTAQGSGVGTGHPLPWTALTPGPMNSPPSSPLSACAEIGRGGRSPTSNLASLQGCWVLLDRGAGDAIPG